MKSLVSIFYRINTFSLLPFQLDTESSLAKINFLNSIIADMQQKNDALKAKVQTLEMLPMDFTK